VNLGEGTALGIDWSGAREARRKIWAARLRCAGGGAEVASLLRPFPGHTLAEIVRGLVPWLERQEFDVAGLDFCFGLAAPHMRALGLPLTGPAAVGAELRLRFADADAFRLAVGPERRRQTDSARRAPFCPTNLRMYRQTFRGLSALARLSLPVPPWRVGEPAVVEILPADVSRRLGATGKSTPQQRDEAVARLAAAGVAVEPGIRRTILADRDGDALDAVLAAVAAAAARARRYAGAPPESAGSGEGWIFSLEP
jgi:hypothetical protein